MDLLIIGIAAFLTAILTFFSGFGLGTMLLPVFAIFFPIDVSIALTGIVHFANAVFKLILVGKNTNKTVLLRFGLPAIGASFAGAWLMLKLTDIPIILNYTLFGKDLEITVIKLVIAILLFGFSVVEFFPKIRTLQFDRKNLFAGGLLSGFFGGLSGIQGALRSAFLLRAGLGKEAYIATGVFIAALVDVTRLSVYSAKMQQDHFPENEAILITAIVAALSGAVIGKIVLKKVTIFFINRLVAVMLLLISFALGSGLI